MSLPVSFDFPRDLFVFRLWRPFDPPFDPPCTYCSVIIPYDVEHHSETQHDACKEFIRFHASAITTSSAARCGLLFPAVCLAPVASSRGLARALVFCLVKISWMQNNQECIAPYIAFSPPFASQEGSLLLQTTPDSGPAEGLRERSHVVSTIILNNHVSSGCVQI